MLDFESAGETVSEFLRTIFFCSKDALRFFPWILMCSPQALHSRNFLVGSLRQEDVEVAPQFVQHFTGLDADLYDRFFLAVDDLIGGVSGLSALESNIKAERGTSLGLAVFDGDEMELLLESIEWRRFGIKESGWIVRILGICLI